ncbi:hypothetical protein PHMEG_00017410 [Phytophthora megakarya]|uniref:Uncharacterized protein n=1 Tax=Phytophthora megakarya TaxID=4795 RepID=A0A225VWK2_9STRA|nr:hypothetical protein PHMEG_00017410 [Phytophthora megakarya]
MQEFFLLELYHRLREQAKNATDKGRKASAWNSLVAQRNASDVASSRESKVNRLMHTYDLYKSIMNLSGVDIDDNKPTLDDDVSEELIKSKDKSLLKKIREFGFPHVTVYSLIARTGNNVGSSSIEVGASSTTAPTTSTAAKTTAPATRNPSSHQQRDEKVNRIRGGDSKSHRSKKKAMTSEDSNMDDMMRTLKLYIKMKIMDLKVHRSSADSDTHHPDQQLGDGGLESHRIRSTGDKQQETKEGYNSAFFPTMTKENRRTSRWRKTVRYFHVAIERAPEARTFNYRKHPPMHARIYLVSVYFSFVSLAHAT